MKRREFMAETLRELQKIQMWALEHSIYAFHVDENTTPLRDEGEGKEGLIREYGDTEERALYVTIYTDMDLRDEHHLHVDFYQGDSDADFFRKINNIKAFIGMEE